MDKERPWGAGPMVTGGSRDMECRVCLCVSFLDKPKPPPVLTLALTGTCNLSGPRKELSLCSGNYSSSLWTQTQVARQGLNIGNARPAVTGILLRQENGRY